MSLRILTGRRSDKRIFGRNRRHYYNGSQCLGSIVIRNSLGSAFPLVVIGLIYLGLVCLGIAELPALYLLESNIQVPRLGSYRKS